MDWQEQNYMDSETISLLGGINKVGWSDIGDVEEFAKE